MRYAELMDEAAEPEQAPLVRTGPGWQPLNTLVEAAYAALDDMSDEEFERFERMPPWRKVAYRYLAGDCDNFAVGLHRVTGWPIIGNTAHRLVKGPRGLLDASGWVTPEKLQRRYREWWTELGEPGNESHAHGAEIGDLYGGIDEILAEVVSAIRQFPWAPYSQQWFRQMSFQPVLGVDTPVPGHED